MCPPSQPDQKIKIRKKPLRRDATGWGNLQLEAPISMR